MPPTSTEQHPASSGEVSAKGRILVVEDEPSVRLSFRLALETVGWVVDEVEESDQALNALGVARDAKVQAGHGSGYHAMVLDFRMPGRTGVDMIAEMIRRELFVPTLLASAHLDDVTVIEAARLGVADFLRKPVSLAGLRDGVERIVEDERQFIASCDETEKTNSEQQESPEGAPDTKGLFYLRGLIRRRRMAEARQVLADQGNGQRDPNEEASIERSAWESLLKCLEQRDCEHSIADDGKPLFGLLARIT